jgi:ABC-type Fe3+/spermidine/putrescine transport system ATPase subunit
MRLQVGDALIAMPTTHLAVRPVLHQRYQLAIRPEHVTVQPQPPNGAVSLTGSVERVAFQGTHHNIAVRTAAGTLSARAIAEFRAGDQVAVTWNPSDARLLPE